MVIKIAVVLLIAVSQLDAYPRKSKHQIFALTTEPSESTTCPCCPCVCPTTPSDVTTESGDETTTTEDCSD